MHSSSAAMIPSISQYGSAERSFRNHSEASEEAAMTRQVRALADNQGMLASREAGTSDTEVHIFSPIDSSTVTSSLVRLVSPTLTGPIAVTKSSHTHVCGRSLLHAELTGLFRIHFLSGCERIFSVQIRILKKKVQQIEGLEVRGGSSLDTQQLAKVAAKPLLASALALLEQGTPLPEVQALLAGAREGALLPMLVHAGWWEDLNVAGYHRHFSSAPLRQ